MAVRPLPVVLALILVVGAVVSPAAQRRGGGNRNAGLPVATNTIRLHPKLYEGKAVTVAAAVEQVLSPTAFVVDQRKATGPKAVAAVCAPLLIVAPTLMEPLTAKGGYMMLTGQVQLFNPSSLGTTVPGYHLDIPAEVAATYAGQPMLVVTSVLDSKQMELARQPAPPAAAEPAKK